MQLTKKDKLFDPKRVQQILINENKFISDWLSLLSLPKRNANESGEEDDKEENGNAAKPRPNGTTRAKSLTELQQRLSVITSKKKLTYKEKLAKKSLKNRMKKKSKQDERNAQRKLLRAQKTTEAIKNEPDEVDVKPAKPVFNSEDKMVFSKFDLSSLGAKKEKKTKKDPKKVLETLQKEKEQLTELEEKGEVGKVVEIKEKAAWKKALAKAEGEKVKDDPILLKKTVQRQEQKKRSSKKKWKSRLEGVEKAKDDRQKKRMENINQKKSDKKKHKLKKAAKKGKIIPGF